MSYLSSREVSKVRDLCLKLWDRWPVPTQCRDQPVVIYQYGTIIQTTNFETSQDLTIIHPSSRVLEKGAYLFSSVVKGLAVSKWVIPERTLINMPIILTHSGRVMPSANHNWFQILACHLVGTKPLSKAMIIVNQNLGNIFQRNLKRNSYIQENTSEYVVCEMLAIFLGPNVLKEDYRYDVNFLITSGRIYK